MPGSKVGTSMRRTSRKRDYARYRASRINRNLKALMDTRAKRVVNRMAEKKWYTSHTAVDISQTGNIDWLSQIPQGDTDLTRDGDQCRLTSLSFKGNLIAASTDGTNTVRIIIFKWNDNNIVSAPDLDDILTATGTGEVPLGMYQQDNVRSKRFNILYDKLYSLDDFHPQTIINTKIKMRSPINFNGGGTTGRGHIYLLYVSNSNATPHPTLNYAFKFVFTDT